MPGLLSLIKWTCSTTYFEIIFLLKKKKRTSITLTCSSRYFLVPFLWYLYPVYSQATHKFCLVCQRGSSPCASHLWTGYFFPPSLHSPSDSRAEDQMKNFNVYFSFPYKSSCHFGTAADFPRISWRRSWINLQHAAQGIMCTWNNSYWQLLLQLSAQKI